MAVQGCTSSPRAHWQAMAPSSNWHPHVLTRTNRRIRLCLCTSSVATAQQLQDSMQLDRQAEGAKSKRARTQKHRTQNLAELGHNSHRVVIAYDGSNYRGWQLQLDEPTVQHAMEKALMAILGEARTKLGVSAAGRTDTGVHAHGQVVQFFTDKEPDTSRLHLALNSHLPIDIRALSAHRTAPDFHVTISAQAKTYRYQIETGRVHNPLTHHFKTHIPYPLDTYAMQQAAVCFHGKHDFSQFSNQSSDTARRNPVKIIHSVNVTPTCEGIQIEVKGTGFLYKQVRHMVGALIAVGRGQRTADDIIRCLSQPPSNGTHTHKRWTVVPAKGLSLYQVHYSPSVDDPQSILYPDYPHDEWGRLIFKVPDLDEQEPDWS